MDSYRNRAVVILSGGLDSTTCMALADCRGEDIFALTFAYNQRHIREIESARDVARHYGASHHIIDLGAVFAASALTSAAIRPEVAPFDGKAAHSIPATYVPARNILFLAHALSFAEKVGARRIYTGVNALDNPGYPDCRPEFIDAFQRMIDVGTKAGTEGRSVEVFTPLIQMNKADIIRLASELDAPLHLTLTCYYGESPACGECDSCRLRLEGFRLAGKEDPIHYRKG
ncbi:7-cyano-7-deazaguanine synthase QueC [Heliobacterium gestii]|uniref:7-cyano-7-deazaguanine synthase n=1 Tax=Heliomicrobium gestii TaxID=2699 RepID=A0A845L4X9_HELGE|nr:7-cyano-7-deazaguanine synthase QueC [Heliomicrobium gestii]MBM7865377.1 7-cyano-7-deazaguanine synthase [Heliomicrobium gestii]MZP41637.1 7-cyano-7-deazaguanine synthase QueC [Heliomicrobium gestii]